MHLRDITSLLLLASLVGLQLQLSSAADESLSHENNINNKNNNNYNNDGDDDDDVFYDASKDFSSSINDDGADEIFYDVADEMSFQEDEGEENVCSTSSSHDCHRCCQSQGFDLPFWNRTIGQCFCYLSYGEENICKEADQSRDACRDCCLSRGYRAWNYQKDAPNACFCSDPDLAVFSSSFKVSRLSS